MGPLESVAYRPILSQVSSFAFKPKIGRSLSVAPKSRAAVLTAPRPQPCARNPNPTTVPIWPQKARTRGKTRVLLEESMVEAAGIEPAVFLSTRFRPVTIPAIGAGFRGVLCPPVPRYTLQDHQERGQDGARSERRRTSGGDILSPPAKRPRPSAWKTVAYVYTGRRVASPAAPGCVL